MRKSVIINLACIVDAWQLETWDSYRDVLRLGRKTRLPEQQRVALRSMFARVRADLASRGVITVSEMFTKLAWAIASSKTPPFDLAAVDEAYARWLGAPMPPTVPGEPRYGAPP